MAGVDIGLASQFSQSLTNYKFENSQEMKQQHEVGSHFIVKKLH